MCRVTRNDDSVSPPLCRKRSSFSSSSRSSSTSSIRKRVSFDENITVRPFERLKTDQLSDVFYCPDDYRRFRSDTCLELLDQQLIPHSGIVNRCRTLLAEMTKERTNRRRKKEKHALKPADYPWMTAYHPQEQPPQVQPSQPVVPRRTIDAEEARRMVEELAFFR